MPFIDTINLTQGWIEGASILLSVVIVVSI